VIPPGSVAPISETLQTFGALRSTAVSASFGSSIRKTTVCGIFSGGAYHDIARYQSRGLPRSEAWWKTSTSPLCAWSAKFFASQG